jgi:hypothetical protein
MTASIQQRVYKCTQTIHKKVGLNESGTPEVALRIRITAAPDLDAFAEYDVQRFRVGDVYEVPVRLGTLLIIAGYAVSAAGVALPAAQAADFSSTRGRPRKK